MIWLLLVLYQIKHFVCDYPLQGKYMLGKFKGGNEWILPLLAHSVVHGVATFLIALCVKPNSAFWLALFDVTVHFCMDRVKASPNLLGRFKPLTKAEYTAYAKQRSEATTIIVNSESGSDSCNGALDIISACDRQFKSNVYFWWALGLDQGVHHLTHYAIIWSLL